MIAVEIEEVAKGGARLWRLTLFFDDAFVAEAVGDTVPDAAVWIVHRLERNLERGREALRAMGLIAG